MSAKDLTWASYMMPQIIPSFSKNTQSEQVHSSSAEILKLLAALLVWFPFRFSLLSWIVISICCHQSYLHTVFILFMLLIVCFYFFFELCLLVVSFALYFWWMNFILDFYIQDFSSFNEYLMMIPWPNDGPQWTSTHQGTHPLDGCLLWLSCGWSSTELLPSFILVTCSIRSRSNT